MTNANTTDFRFFGEDVSLEKEAHVDLNTLYEGTEEEVAKKVAHVGMCAACRKALLEKETNEAQQN